MKGKRLIILFFIFSLLLPRCRSLYAQGAPLSQQYRKICVAFYNVENLFDTIDQPEVRDEEYLPGGPNKWTSERYYHKIENIASVISLIGGSQRNPGAHDRGQRPQADGEALRGPAVIGLSEIENSGVLQDLVNTPALRQNNYGIAHFDSPEPRGVDVALLYARDIFTLTEAYPHPTVIPEEPDFRTRDILRVSGTIDGETFHFLVAHWSSRSGGEKISEYKRMGCARTMRRIVDSLIAADPRAKIILMGDFNDDPVDKSVKRGLRVCHSPKNLLPADLFTPMTKLYKTGIGSLAYRDTWNLFDIMVVNGNLLGSDYREFKVMPDPKTRNYAYVFRRGFMLQKEGRYKGYPLRTLVGGQYQGGYSDHLPVYLYLAKQHPDG